MDCGTLITVISIIITLVGIMIYIPILSVPNKEGWKHDLKGVGISFGKFTDNKTRPTTDTYEMEKDSLSYDINYGITIKNLFPANAKINKTVLKLRSKGENITIEYAGRWWDRMRENLYRGVNWEAKQNIELGWNQEEDIVLFYKNNGEYFLFSNNTDKEGVHPKNKERLNNFPYFGKVVMYGQFIKKSVFFVADIESGEIKIKIIRRFWWENP